VDPSIFNGTQSINCLVPGQVGDLDPGYVGKLPGQGLCAVYIGTKDVSLQADYGASAIAGYVYGFPKGRNIKIGTKIIISGNNTGTGSISGYSNPTTYYVVGSDAVPTYGNIYELGLTPGGTPVTITAGTLTGLIFTCFGIFGGTNAFT